MRRVDRRAVEEALYLWHEVGHSDIRETLRKGDGVAQQCRYLLDENKALREKARTTDNQSDAVPFDDRAEEAQQEAADQIAEERAERGED